METNLVTIATFATPVEAALAKNRLESDGIIAYLADAETVGMVWMFGNALGGVKLQVADSDAVRAVEILDHQGIEAGGADEVPADAIQAAEPCPRCGMDVNPVLTVCPACGMALSADDEISLSPTAVTATKPSDAGDYPVVSPGEDLANRALRASIFGLLICPPTLNLYSLWLLMRLAALPEDLSETAIRKIKTALAVNAVILFVVGVAALMVFN